MRDDGTERVLNPRREQEAAEPPPAPVRLILIVTGHTFWYAWDPPRGAAIDPILRLQISIDEESVATYVDARQDPDELPRVPFVNSFTFAAADVALAATGPARLLPPETRPGRTVLRIELPEEEAGERRLMTPARLVLRPLHLAPAPLASLRAAGRPVRRLS